MVWRMFSWHSLGLLEPNEHLLKTTAYLSMVADHVHLFMCIHLLMAASSKIMCYATKLKSSQTPFLKIHSEFTVVKNHPQSPHLNPVEYL